MTQPPGDATTPAQPPHVYLPPQPQPPAQPQPLPTQPIPPTQPLPYPPSAGYPQPYQPPQPYQWYQQPEPPRKKRTGLLIGILAAVFVLFLAGGVVSAYLLTRDTTKGQATPAAAVDGFLTAVYTNHDATAATKFVCPQARDRAKLAAKIDEIKQRDSKYELPKYTWRAPVTQSDKQATADEARLTTTVTLRTGNEQKAEQPLLFVTTRHNGWWVCEVKQGG
jgi:hypothetical protein